MNITLNPADPMVTIYCSIGQLQKLEITTGIPYSSAQQLKFGLTLIWNARDFEKALSKWNKIHNRQNLGKL